MTWRGGDQDEKGSFGGYTGDHPSLLRRLGNEERPPRESQPARPQGLLAEAGQGRDRPSQARPWSWTAHLPPLPLGEQWKKGREGTAMVVVVMPPLDVLLASRQSSGDARLFPLPQGSAYSPAPVASEVSHQ